MAADTFRLSFAAPAWAQTARAGQFVNIQMPQHGDLLWRRPFSVHDADSAHGTLDILFAAVGRGSRALSRCKPGDALDVLGLLGNSFTEPAEEEEVILVAGGLGVAPFMLLLRQLRHWPGKKTVFLGFRSSRQVCCAETLVQRGARIVLSSDDGSAGVRGLVTTALEDYLISRDARQKVLLYVCGPTPMLRSVRAVALQYHIPAQVTVENRMACGFGACVGCPVELAQPRPDGQKYLLACKDGPVFPLEEIVFND